MAEPARGGDPTAWFDRLYRAAEAGEAVVPWNRRAPHRLLVEWAQGHGVVEGVRALVVGCGLGDDAEYVASLGHATIAFDVAEAAVEGARRRFPASDVEYVVADVLDPPARWQEAFGLVLESLTVQSLPERLHRAGRDAARDRNRARRGGAGRRAAVAADAERDRCFRFGRPPACADRGDPRRAAAFAATLAGRVPARRVSSRRMGRVQQHAAEFAPMELEIVATADAGVATA